MVENLNKFFNEIKNFDKKTQYRLILVNAIELIDNFKEFNHEDLKYSPTFLLLIEFNDKIKAFLND